MARSTIFDFEQVNGWFPRLDRDCVARSAIGMLESKFVFCQAREEIVQSALLLGLAGGKFQ